MARLGDICEILNGFAFKSEQYVDEGVRIIRIANVQKGYIEDNTPVFYPSNSQEVKKYALEADDLLMSLTGNVGRVARLNKQFIPAALNQRVACIRIKNEAIINKSYLFNLLNSDYFEEQCVVSAKGVAQKNMSTEWLREYEIPLLSMEEQQKIATVLDKVTNVISLRKQQLAKLDDLVKARFVEMFGDIHASKRYPYKSVNELTAVISGGTPSRAIPEYWNGNIPWVKTTELQNNRITVVDEYITKAGLNESAAKIVPAGTILIAMYGQGKTRGMTGYLDIEASTNQACACILPNDNVEPIYLWQYFIFSYDKLRNMAKGGNQPNLNSEIVKSFPVLCPPMPLQHEFATFFEQLDRQKLTITQSRDKLEVLKKSLMQEYFGERQDERLYKD